ncbi:MAG: hypothetical protein ACXWFS_07360 [Thermoanaerobaculia bacterium]
MLVVGVGGTVGVGVGMPPNGVGVGVPAKGVAVGLGGTGVTVGVPAPGVGVAGTDVGVNVAGVAPSPDVGVAVGGVPVKTAVGVGVETEGVPGGVGEINGVFVDVGVGLACPFGPVMSLVAGQAPRKTARVAAERHEARRTG